MGSFISGPQWTKGATTIYALCLLCFLVANSSSLSALAAWATVVFLANELVKSNLFPFGMQFHLEVFRPRCREDIRIIHRKLVRDCVGVDAAKPFDRVKSLGVHTILFRILVVVIVQRPSFEVCAIDDQSVSFPMADRVPVVSGFNVFLMRATIQRDHSRDALKLRHHHQPVLRLHYLNRIWTEKAGRKT